mgnify:CR=1 FL=1
MRQICPLEVKHHDAVVEVYRQAVLCCPAALYTAAQQSAWEAQASRLRPTLLQGQGLVSCGADGQIEAFGLREPEDRVSLLYCHPRSWRQGHAQAVLHALEAEALAAGCRLLRTEASFLSRSLFAKQGWQVSWQEELRIGDQRFRRFRMHKQLGSILA